MIEHSCHRCGGITELRHISGPINDSEPFWECRGCNEVTPAKPSSALADLESLAILDSLEGNNYSISISAKELGITRQTLYNRLREWGMETREGFIQRVVERRRREIAEQRIQRIPQDRLWNDE